MSTRITRRQFLAATLTTGFALAVRPIQAETLIHTDTATIVADWVSVPSQGGMLPAYMAHPDHGENWPVMVVVQEIFGVHAHIQDVCRRFAKLGYLAIAPELFFRQGDVSQLKEINDILTQVVSKVPDKQVMADIDATLDWVKQSTHANASKVAISGFCWGGRIVWLYAVHNPHINTGIAWYGRLAGTATALQPFYPLDVASHLKVPVLGLYGGQDQGIAVATVDTMLFALNAGTSQSSIHIYPDAPHAFFADYRASYRQDAAEDSWRRMQVWLKNHGMGT